MPQPLEVTDAATRLTAVYARAQERLLEQLRVALLEPTRARQQRRLAQQLRSIAAYRASLEEATKAWMGGGNSTLATVHALGATAAAADLGTAFAWTAPHVEAVEALARRSWADVAARLQDMEAGTRRAIRALTGDIAEQVLVDGRTAAGAGRLLERWMGEQGIGTVTYRNGARHLVADYADTLARTVTAEAYNSGTFVQLEQDGVEWVEVLDGADCGWRSHDDPDKANGTVRRLTDAQQHSLSHPRCARSFAGVVGITSAAEAEAFRRFSPAEQGRLAAEERARDATSSTTLTGRARSTRAARAGKPARVARVAR